MTNSWPFCMARYIVRAVAVASASGPLNNIVFCIFARSPKPVAVAPGQASVMVTPLPRISSAIACVNETT